MCEAVVCHRDVDVTVDWSTSFLFYINNNTVI